MQQKRNGGGAAKPYNPASEQEEEQGELTNLWKIKPHNLLYFRLPLSSKSPIFVKAMNGLYKNQFSGLPLLYTSLNKSNEALAQKLIKRRRRGRREGKEEEEEEEYSLPFSNTWASYCILKVVILSKSCLFRNRLSFQGTHTTLVLRTL